MAIAAAAAAAAADGWSDLVLVLKKAGNVDAFVSNAYAEALGSIIISMNNRVEGYPTSLPKATQNVEVSKTSSDSVWLAKTSTSSSQVSTMIAHSSG